jgi:hypothetical protein
VVLTVDIPSVPKRGDLIHTNVGNRRERTCFIVKVHVIRPGRYRLTAVRWWEIEPEFRGLLFRHAERNGGQNVILFKRYPARKRLTFEAWMRRKITH